MRKPVFTLLFLIMSLSCVNAAKLDRFYIKRAYQLDDTDNYVPISQNSNFTQFTAEYTVTRALRSYGLENLNWIVTLVAIGEEDGISYEQNISKPITLTHTDGLSQMYNNLEILGTMPNNLLHFDYVEIRLKYEQLSYDETSGDLINTDRDVTYSKKLYVTTRKEHPNPFLKGDLKLFSTYYSILRKASYVSGGYWNFSENWENVQGMASLNGFLYIVQAGNLHKLNPETGEYTILGTMGDWNGTDAVAGSSNGFLYIVQNSRIHKVDPITGAYVILGNPEWSATEAMVAYQGNLYVVQNSRLHRVSENTGAITLISEPDWGGTKAIASSGDGFIYIIQNSYLHKISTEDASFTILGEQVWANTHQKGMTFYNNSLYVIRNGVLLKVEKGTGSITNINSGYNGCAYLTSL
ncbi:hypothetical protein [Pedobacter gandavensis]|uniref:hypothetical protein n=1 Tax=Pedobacter gandavensis TaxID=2679963 RepID=UPI00292E0B91|nr:hypothetical protein [Pedobacter gandavensis]